MTSNKLSTLKTLEELLILKKREHLKLFQSRLLKNNTIYIYDNILESINKLNDLENEKSRIDWKNGYIQCVLDYGESFGLSRKESYPNKKELNVIDDLSNKY